MSMRTIHCAASKRDTSRAPFVAGALGLALALAAGCKGDPFTSGTPADAGAEPGPAPVGSPATPSGPGTGPCAAVECVVPDCPPQLQFTPLGECCPACVTPRVCENGARCSALSCPGEMTELSDGCCECDDVECSGEALPCSDPMCVGAEQEVLGDGCCICGEPLACDEGQVACDAILCDGDVLYEGDGCCRCRETTCGAGSTRCEELSCDGDILAVGGGCCECDEPLACAEGTACDELDCDTEVVQLAPGCCECAASNCGGEVGQFDCAVGDCQAGIEQLPNGCCQCSEPSVCEEGSTACAMLMCPEGESLDVGGGCCACSTCPAGSVDCDAIDCSSDVVVVAEGCCECETEECDAALQESYDEYLSALIDDLGDPACSGAEDCVLVDIENRCRVECGAALHSAIAEELLSELEQWAEKNCDACPRADVECEASGMLVAADCAQGVCVRR